MENKNWEAGIHGADDMGWDIYVIGMKDGKNVVIPAIKVTLMQITFLIRSVVCQCACAAASITAIGGITSRRLGLPCIGRPMTVWGIRRSYPHLVDLVNRVKQNIAARYDYY